MSTDDVQTNAMALMDDNRHASGEDRLIMIHRRIVFPDKRWEKSMFLYGF